MKLTALIILTLGMTVAARKCACKGGRAHSKKACDVLGHVYGTTGCGFTGCCVNPGAEEEAFINECGTLGYGFLQCNDCPKC
ncbi:uncharacterized protein BDR25DRAFT_35800 [Lindgomyces ingoldianus]|uniref:Uncharacterized protein n=1 Tax=Lindgomyces ingoldianus TaxID=673940 RepID=A0ACB6QUK7_9PLEO|nr:uncharacterized protein BDR25DRAFT_35800 [Lindgomyces ingoldianus]KAF2469962.1 hypothetical protein BDR25DRAFT_35800 [Lindgomyces ingoldianus]